MESSSRGSGPKKSACGAELTRSEDKDVAEKVIRELSRTPRTLKAIQQFQELTSRTHVPQNHSGQKRVQNIQDGSEEADM